LEDDQIIPEPKVVPNVLTIAGSDPSGGAGIQADLKTFAALGAYGCAVITALTAQNTQTVASVHAPPAEFVALQLQTLFDDVAIDAIKVGMVANAEIARIVARELKSWKQSFPNGIVVVDPVMVSKAGHSLVDRAAELAIRDQLLPLANVITPNRHEAAVLLNKEVPQTLAEMDEAARQLFERCSTAVLVKGGGLPGATSQDAFYDGLHNRILSAPRMETRSLHGTGCTLSAAIAAYAAAGMPLSDAVAAAKQFVTLAMQHSAVLNVGQGFGPLNHGYSMTDVEPLSSGPEPSGEFRNG
jgi:hydroxymethylpyrimidine/phosphomethylpyrimidine kinase